MKKNGFTLVELLAVIAILAILVAIVMPNVMKEFNKAKANVFVSDSKSIMNYAISEFTTDAMSNSGKTIYYSSESNSDLNTSQLNVDTNKKYFIEMDRHGNFKRFVIYDESYCYDIYTTYGDASIGIIEGTKSKNNNGQPITKEIISEYDVWDSGNDSVDVNVTKNADEVISYFVKGCEASSHSFDNDIQSEINVTSLYGVLQKEAEEGTYAKKYTGEHKDSYTRSATHDVYHFHADNDDEANVILNKNNVVFANHCWQMIRTTDTGGVKLLYNGEVDSNGKCGNDRGAHYGGDYGEIITLDSNYYYGSGHKYDSSIDKFSLDGDIQLVKWNDSTYSSLIGKYTCKLDTLDGTCTNIYYIDSYASSTSARVLSLSYNMNYSILGKTVYNLDDNGVQSVGYKYGDKYLSISEKPINSSRLSKNVWVSATSGTHTYGSSASYTGNGYKLINTSTINYSSWTSEHNKLKNKYTCGGNSTTCSSPRYVTFTNKVGYTYYNYYDDKIRVGRSYEGNKINDSMLITKYDLYKIKYESYKYTCNSTSETCNNVYYIISYFSEDVFRNNSFYPENSVQYYANRLKSEGFYYTTNTYYAKSVTYENGKYKLNDVVKFVSVDNLDFLSSHHYTCLQPDVMECDKIAYVFYMFSTPTVSNSDMVYVLLENGEDIDDLFYNSLKKNNNDSFLKKYVDDWYEIFLSSYSSNLEETIFCNDRSFLSDGSDDDFSLSGWNPVNGSVKNILFFNNIVLNTNLKCVNSSDQFSVDNDSAKLDYSIGIPSVNEIYLLGDFQKLLDSSVDYWLSSPKAFYSSGSSIYYMGSSGILNTSSPDVSKGIRPMISLKAGTGFVSGDGSVDTPYIVN